MSATIRNSCKTTIDFTVHRLSGARVYVTWHTVNESGQVRFEVLRRHKTTEPFVSIGVAEPKSQQDGFTDYSFVDTNEYRDSSFYCLKKYASDVIFYSLAKGVEGVGKTR